MGLFFLNLAAAIVWQLWFRKSIKERTVECCHDKYSCLELKLVISLPKTVVFVRVNFQISVPSRSIKKKLQFLQMRPKAAFVAFLFASEIPDTADAASFAVSEGNNPYQLNSIPSH